ncbi:MAG TPA: hypothetical protein VF601_00090 [Beijerinckiaceae bacterium]|jgi:hypothetical protein
MRPLVIALLAGFVLTGIGPAFARTGGGAPRAGRDACQTEADQMFRGVKNLDQRHAQKQAHIKKCRAASR